MPFAPDAIVTVCGVDQLAGVKVSDPPALTVRFVVPVVLAVVTVTLDVGADDSATVKSAVLPRATLGSAG